jgi:hypothetical protein
VKGDRMKTWGKVAALIAGALALGGCAFGMVQMTPEQLEAMAKNREASIACFDGTYAGAKIKMLFVNADKGVPAGVSVGDDCKLTLDTNKK